MTLGDGTKKVDTALDEFKICILPHVFVFDVCLLHVPLVHYLPVQNFQNLYITNHFVSFVVSLKLYFLPLASSI